MKQIKIEPVALKDLEPLQQISKATFSQTFAAENSAADMEAYLEKAFSSEKLAQELSDPNAAFYFAIYQEEIIGYLKVNVGLSQTELKDPNALEIERIYVLNAFHGKNAGQQLYEKAIEVATRKKLKYVWLGVWEENKRAIRFYQKNGFEVFDKHLFILGNDAQTDLMMRLYLRPA